MKPWKVPLSLQLVLVLTMTVLTCCIAVYELVTNRPGDFSTWLWIAAALLWLIAMAVTIIMAVIIIKEARNR